MKKRKIIENLYRFIIKNRVGSTLECKTGEMSVTPYTISGREFEIGIMVSYSDGFQEVTRQFYFPEIMEEEFIRFVNRNVLKGELQKELDRLTLGSHLRMTG